MALGHPKGLFPLFFTEMWERLAFYTIVGILLLYATDVERGGLGLPASRGNEIYGLYLAFVYFTPFLGGMIADRFLGYRRAVFLGGLLMAGGLFLMGTPGFLPFTLGLVALIIGNGFFKPNISVMVGNLYEPGDHRRDAGFQHLLHGHQHRRLPGDVVRGAGRAQPVWLAVDVSRGGVRLDCVAAAFCWRPGKCWPRPTELPSAIRRTPVSGRCSSRSSCRRSWSARAGYFLAKAYLPPSIPLRPAVCGFLAGMIPVIIFFVRLGLTAREEEKPGLLSLLPIYIAGGAFFMILHLNGSAMTQWARDDTDRRVQGSNTFIQILNPWAKQDALPNYYRNADETTPLSGSAQPVGGR